jgi:hypothetical protein
VSNETLTGLIQRAERADSLPALRNVVVELALALRQVAAERDRHERTRSALLTGMERAGRRH